MDLRLEIPPQVPVMTLPSAVLFPQAIMPLHIFEQRYRAMLDACLDGSRLFAVARLDENEAASTGQFEPPFPTATLGVIRACQRNDDGTSNLVLQGLVRVEIVSIVQEEPFRMVEIRPLTCAGAEDELSLQQRRSRVDELLDEQNRLTGVLTDQFLEFVRSVDDADAFIDLVAYTLCTDSDEKQHLLETLDTEERYKRFIRYLSHKNERLRIQKKLQGNLGDDEIELN